MKATKFAKPQNVYAKSHDYKSLMVVGLIVCEPQNGADHI